MADGEEENIKTSVNDEKLLVEEESSDKKSPKHNNESTDDPGKEATESSSSKSDDEDDVNMQEDMSTFKYTRISGPLPRKNSEENQITSTLGALSNVCTSMKIGRIRLPREEDGQQEQQAQQQGTRKVDWSVWQQPHYAILSGFDNGTLSFIDVESGEMIIPTKQLKVSESSSSDAAIVDVSLDASSNYLSAINARGTCAIWEVRYSTRRSVTQTGAPQAAVFSSLITTLSGQSSIGGSDTQGEETRHLHLMTSSLQCTRILYPSSSFGRPTCMLIDPSYKRRREKLTLVGFDNGKLVLTKRGFLQLRSDVVIYQGTSKASGDGGIESLAWRGALVAWADFSGIKLFDVESMNRIAHIDRPTGARASLYPTISFLRPTLLFETSDDLLVTWGDCVMSVHIKEIIVTPKQQSQTFEGAASAGGQPTPTDPSPSIVKKRQVECKMAWELDCIASGVAPLDKDHLVVLGVVPKEDEDDDADKSDELNDLEVQVISRSAGTVTYADYLPLLKHESRLHSPESAADYHFLSTFAIPRMENAWEVEDEEIAQHGTTDQDYGFNIFAPSSSNSPFLDFHLRWDLKMLDFDAKEETTTFELDDGDSVDSDDYGFILRQPSCHVISKSLEKGIAGPLMVIGSPGDLITARTLTVDDAISHALSSKKVGLALQRAMRYKRHLRRHDINVVGDEFLKAVLRLENLAHDAQDKQKLSIRRLELAAKSTQTLIGGNSQRWKYWVEEFSRMPGALFVLWRELPVRDPKLPAELYKEVLHNLYDQVEEMLSTSDDEVDICSNEAISKAVDNFLFALSAWGPTHALKEKARFHEYFVENQRNKTKPENSECTIVLQNINMALERRLTQSAIGYLEFPSEIYIKSTSQPNAANRSIIADSSSDSLFHVPTFLSYFSSRLPLVRDESNGRHEEITDVSPSLLNTKVAFDAFADLNIMTAKYEIALRSYLLVGHLFSDEKLEEIERKAIYYVNKGEYERVECNGDNNSNKNSYGFVIAMIEQHHLHGLLLDKDFLRVEGAYPLVSLIRLLGLEVVADFLVDHCVPPPIRSVYGGSVASASSSVKSAESDSSRVTTEGDETLPITRVAEQIRTSPQLLHWYLHLIFKRRSEMYVQFPTTAVPPMAVTELHRSHLDLYIEYAAEDRDSAQSLSKTELYNQERKTTPLLLFLKAALPLGGIQPTEVRRLLEAKRVESLEDITEFPKSFAIELAYVIENYGENSEEESFQVLDLYLKGAKSVMLAVTYAQRNTEHGSVLWEAIIQYCLTGGESNEIEAEEGKIDGTLFGSLLEVGALCGADLARLVSSIPQGMNIEGLRPRLVAAVADYRMKLKMHEASADTCRRDRICLLREAGHRSRRGMRQIRPFTNFPISTQNQSEESPELSENREQSQRRPVERPSRYRISVRLPMR